MLQPQSGTIFALIFQIAKNLISFSEALFDFMTKPLGETIYTPFESFYTVPIIGDILQWLMNISRTLLPWSPMTILGGVGLFVILGLILVKKLVPVA